MSSLEDLISLAPPPTKLTCAGSTEDFIPIETKLGTALPLDFKQLTNAYGTGGWLWFYWLINPLDPRHHSRWFDDSHFHLRHWRDQKRLYPDDPPYPIWPDRGGLLPWGGNENGGDLFWLTEGEPDHWPTIMTHDRTPEYIRLDQTATEIVLAAVTQTNPVVAEIPWGFLSTPAYAHRGPKYFQPG